MVKGSGAVHVARIKSSHVDKSGRRRDYESVYLRRSYRDGKKVKHEQVANLTALPEAAIEAIEAVLAGHALVPASDAVRIARSVPHGHVAAVWAQARALGLPGLLGPAGRHRDLAMALVVARVLRPGSKLATAGWWADTTLGADLDVSTASTDEVYAAMDWLHSRQDAIEARLAARHLAEEVNPSRMALFDLSSSWMEGTHCPLTARGYSRDGKKGKAQIEYGLLTDPEGRPVAIRVFAGNTGDPTAFIDAVKIVREKFGLTKMVMVRDREAGRRPAAAAADPVRPTGPGRDRPPRLPRRASGRLPQPAPGQGTGPQTRGVAGRHRYRAHQDPDRRQSRPAPGGGQDRAQGGQDHRHLQDGQTPRRGHHRHHPGDHPQHRADRGRGQAGRHLRAPHERASRPARRRRRRGRLQEPRPRRARLPHHQGRRPRPAPGLPPARGPGPRPRADLHARRLPDLAPPQGPLPAYLHRRTPTHTRQPGRARRPLNGRGTQGLPPPRHQRPAYPVLPRTPRPPRHTDPQRRPPHRNRAHRADTHRDHPHPTTRLRTTQPAPPAEPEVARTHNSTANKTPAQQGFCLSQAT